MIDPAVLGTARIGLDLIRHEQSLSDTRPARQRSRPVPSRRLAQAAVASLRGLADAIERTWPTGRDPRASGSARGGAAAVAPRDVEYHPVPTRL
jgi:hypothetical protein